MFFKGSKKAQTTNLIKPLTATVKVVGYIRVSTEGQAQARVSLEAQTAKLVAWSQAMDLELDSIDSRTASAQGDSMVNCGGHPRFIEVPVRLAWLPAPSELEDSVEKLLEGSRSQRTDTPTGGIANWLVANPNPSS